MVEKLFSLLFREVRGLHEAAYLLGFFALLSQLLALVRDRMFAHEFGAGVTLDLYYAAFRIPDVVFIGIASLVSVYVLIPFLVERLDRGEELRAYINNVFSFFALLIVVVSLVAYLLTPSIIKLLFPTLVVAGQGDTLVLLTRIMLLQPILLGISSLFASLTQVYQKFVLYAVAPILYNAGIILGILFLYPAYGIAGLAWGVVLGAVFHAGIQVPFIVRERLLPQLVRIRFGELKSLFSLSIPRTLALSANQIVSLVFVTFAALLTPGSISVFTFAFNLQSVPLTIVGVSYSVAAFPTLARYFSIGNQQQFVLQVLTASRHIIFWSLPIIALFVVLRAQIVRVILGSGAFDWADTRLTAAAFALFVLSLSAHALVLLLIRAYYAAGSTRKPVIVSIVSAIVSIASAFVLLLVFAKSEPLRNMLETLLRVEGIPGTEVLMLPLGYTVGMLVQATLLLVFFQRDFSRFGEPLKHVFWQSTAGALTMGIVAYFLLQMFDDIFDINTFIGIFMQGALSGLLGVISGIIVLWYLKSPELFEMWESLHHKFWKTKAVVPETEV
jgi:putative peptidoglycan lipid II flippase